MTDPTRRLIILAAGRGTRLGPAAEGRPKCMVQLRGRPILAWQIAAARAAGFDTIIVIRGYQAHCIDFDAVQYVHNPLFDRSNMVHSLWTAEHLWADACVVSYGDILFEPQVLDELWRTPSSIAVVIDRDWLAYWRMRFDDPLDDAETLRTDAAGHIIEIGQKPTHLDQIQGQYIGLTCFRGQGLTTLRRLILSEQQAHARAQRTVCTQRAYPDLYMTDILQALIHNGQSLQACPTHGRWLEIDRPSDLQLAHQLTHVDPDQPDILRIDRP